MQIRHTLFKNLLKCICHTELPVHDHRMPVPHSHPDRLYHFPMPTRSYGTEIMLIIIYILGSRLQRQIPVAPLVRTGGSRHTGLAALPHRNIQTGTDTDK